MLVRVELDSDPLSNVLSSSFVDEKNILGWEVPTKGDQSDFSAKISYRQN